MEVAVSALRAELKTWIARARDGEEVVITERGVPVARLTGVATADLLTELAREGLLTPAAGDRVPLDSRSAWTERRATRGVADIVRRIRH